MQFFLGVFVGVILGFIACALLVTNDEAERSAKDVHRDGG